MRGFALSLALVTAIGSGAVLGKARQAADGEAPASSDTLKPVDAFASIKDEAARSVALFAEAGKALQHPRCLNCHPAGDRPTQHEAMTPHEPWVVRGADGMGVAAMRCNTCHGEKNFEPSHAPGNPAWRLAPASMAWQGKSLKEICEQLKDRKRNGGKSDAQMILLAKEDDLVGWGWKPGADRQPAPGTQAQFGALIEAWLKSGRHCPEQ